MKQGEIWFVNLNPIKGSEQARYRPVLIISGNLLNQYAPVLICVPITTKIKSYKGNVVLQPSKENGLRSKSEVMVYHIRSLSKDRFIKKIGKVNEQVIHDLKKGLTDILRY